MITAGFTIACPMEWEINEKSLIKKGSSILKSNLQKRIWGKK